MQLLNRPGLAEVIEGINTGKRVMVLERAPEDCQRLMDGPAWSVKPLEGLRLQVVDYYRDGTTIPAGVELTMEVSICLDTYMRPIEPDTELIREIEETEKEAT